MRAPSTIIRRAPGSTSDRGCYARVSTDEQDLTAALAVAFTVLTWLLGASAGLRSPAVSRG